MWTDEDRALLLALLAEQKETCSTCGHPMSICRDPKTAGTWSIVETICQPGRIIAAHVENAAKAGNPMRGVLVGSRRG